MAVGVLRECGTIKMPKAKWAVERLSGSHLFHNAGDPPMLMTHRFVVRSFVFAMVALGLLNTCVAELPASDENLAKVSQRYGFDPTNPIETRVRSTDASVLASFRDAGRPSPMDHPLTGAERAKLKFAIGSLPPLQRRFLRERLRTLSFLDGMPNTALTSTVNPDEQCQVFDITVNAGILSQNVSEWLTQKERKAFETTRSRLRLSVDAGTKFDALLYVLVHEATHVVDSCERITPHLVWSGRPAVARGGPATAFTEGVWSDLSLPVARYRDPLRARARFYADGGGLSLDQAPAVYESLSHTPFVSLYGARNSLDDLAEYVSVYHLTEVLKQPFRIVIRRDDEDVFVYEPMKSELVRVRIGQMKQFYVDLPQNSKRQTRG
jgi:hypothetical protein